MQKKADPTCEKTAAEYSPAAVDAVRTACLTLASKLGDFEDDIVVVGGFAPTLLIAQDDSAPDGRHIGTLDLDLAIALAVLSTQRYERLVAQLRLAGFQPDKDAERNKPVPHRWAGAGITVDFLIAPAVGVSAPNDKTRIISEDLSAISAEAVPLAFEDRRRVTLRGRNSSGSLLTRDVWVCGPGAFVVMKGLALARAKPKDAYDLVYLIRAMPAETLEALKALKHHPQTAKAVALLRRDFETRGHIGPKNAAWFLQRELDDDYLTDCWSAVVSLLDDIEPLLGP